MNLTRLTSPLALGLLLSAASFADVIRVDMAGTVTGVADAQNKFGGAITVGQSYTGYMQYTTTPNSTNSFSLGGTPTVDYSFNTQSATIPIMMSFTVGSTTFTAIVATGHAVLAEVRGDGTVIFQGNDIVTSPDPGYTHGDFEIFTQHIPANSTALPGIAQLSSTTSDWSTQLFYGTYPNAYSSINLGVSSLSFSQTGGAATPEPASIMLMLASGIALVGMKFRARR